jgi:hypothetical protein
MGAPDAPTRYSAFLRDFTADVGEITPANVIAACTRYVHGDEVERASSGRTEHA